MQSLFSPETLVSSMSSTDRWLQETTTPTSAPTTLDEVLDDDGNNTLSKVLSNLALFGLIWGLSATVNMKNLKRQLTNKFAIGCGVAMQFIIMPVLGFIAVVTLRDHGLTEAMGITLLVVTASPGGSYSNWWCSTFNADLALSVAMTTVSSILSIGLLPANLFLYTFLAYGTADDNEESVIEALDFGALFTTLAVVLGAIMLGLYAGYRWDSPRFHVAANRLGSVCGILLIVFSIFISSGADGAESSFWNQPWAFYVGVSFPCLVGIGLANIIARGVRLSPPETVAISIECCYQNTGIATAVAITMFSDKEERAQAVAVPLFYGIVEAVVIGLYCVWAWKVGWTKAPKDEKLCVVISKTYELEDEDEEDDHAKDEGQEHGLDGYLDEFGEPELDPEAMGEVDSNANGQLPEEDEKDHQLVVATGTKHREPEVIGSGFWARVLPPVLRRLTTSFMSSSEVVDDQLEMGKESETTTPAHAAAEDGDDQRNRVVSVDYTVGTSQCSGTPHKAMPQSPGLQMSSGHEAEAAGPAVASAPESPLPTQPILPALTAEEVVEPLATIDSIDS